MKGLRSRKGEGLIQVLVWVVILALIVIAAIQIVPALFDRYELGLAQTNTLKHVNVNSSDEEVRAVLHNAYKTLKLLEEYSPADVEITRRYELVSLRYEWNIDLGIPFTSITYPLTFSVEHDSGDL